MNTGCNNFNLNGYRYWSMKLSSVKAWTEEKGNIHCACWQAVTLSGSGGSMVGPFWYSNCLASWPSFELNLIRGRAHAHLQAARVRARKGGRLRVVGQDRRRSSIDDRPFQNHLGFLTNPSLRFGGDSPPSIPS